MVAAEQFWDGIARKYAARPIADMAAYDRTLERAASYLEDTDRVLEVGCGTGTTALRLAPHVAHITATDLSTELLRVCRERAAEQGVGNVDFTRADLRSAGAEAPPTTP